MCDYYILPTSGVPKGYESAQQYFRNVVNNAPSPINVKYDGDVMYVPKTTAEAKYYLQQDNISDESAKKIRGLIAHYAVRKSRIIDEWNAGLTRRIQSSIHDSMQNNGSLLHDVIDYEAIRLISDVFDFTQYKYLYEIHKAAGCDSEHQFNKAVAEACNSKNSFSSELRRVAPDNIELGMKLAYGVTIQPMANFCAIGLYKLGGIKGAKEAFCVHKLFKDICTTTGPVYPGLFRESGSNPVLIPTTWNGTSENFTFGYGVRSCPGKKIVFNFVSSILTELANIDFNCLSFIPRRHAPYGFSDIIYI